MKLFCDDIYLRSICSTKPEVSTYPLDHKEFFSRVPSSLFESSFCSYIIHNNPDLENLEVSTTITKEIIWRKVSLFFLHISLIPKCKLLILIVLDLLSGDPPIRDIWGLFFF